MIDWIKAVIPCHHEGRIGDGRVISIDDDGEIQWETVKRKSVEGSFSSKVHIKTHDINSILIDGNPAKFLQGHNIFGTNDLLGLNIEFFRRICETCGLSPTTEDINAWREGNYQLLRVDITTSFKLPSQNDVMSWLRAASGLSRGKHQAVSAYSGETIYLGQNSRRISLKIYNKWRELKKHPLPELLPFKKN